MLLKRSLRGTGIEQRYSVCESFFGNELFDEKGQASTGARNRVYSRESRKLAASVAERLFKDQPSLSPGDVTHVVYASCTGFCNPGPDYHLIFDLGLNSGVHRYLLGFMGCYAGIPALRLATQICEADEEAVVLVVCLELCTLHLRIDSTHDSILANSLFADGAGAALVTGRGSGSAASFGDFATAILPEGEEDMHWEIGDQGFELTLSNRIPALVGKGVKTIMREADWNEAIDHWAIHPGGRGILDQAEKVLSLQPDQLSASRQVMQRFGNMAGATIFFVLEEVLKEGRPGEGILTVAFGPGLTVEAGSMTISDPAK